MILESGLLFWATLYVSLSNPALLQKDPNKRLSLRLLLKHVLHWRVCHSRLLFA